MAPAGVITEPQANSTPTTRSTPTPRQPSLRNPLPLSAAQEAQVRDIYYKRVRQRCDPEIKGELPAQDESNAQVSVFFGCKQLLLCLQLLFMCIRATLQVYAILY